MFSIMFSIMFSSMLSTAKKFDVLRRALLRRRKLLLAARWGSAALMAVPVAALFHRAVLYAFEANTSAELLAAAPSDKAAVLVLAMLAIIAAILLSVPYQLGCRVEQSVAERFPLEKMLSPVVSRLTPADVTPSMQLFALGGLEREMVRILADRPGWMHSPWRTPEHSDRWERHVLSAALLVARLDDADRQTLAGMLDARLHGTSGSGPSQYDLAPFLRYSGPVSDVAPLLVSWVRLSPVRALMQVAYAPHPDLPELHPDVAIRTVGVPLAEAPKELLRVLADEVAPMHSPRHPLRLAETAPDLASSERVRTFVAQYAALGQDQLEVVAVLAPDWSGSPEDLLAAARAL
jgi:hypothetical protein